MLINACKVLAKHWVSRHYSHVWCSIHTRLDKVFIQASSLACEVYVEISLLCSLSTMVCEIKVCLISVILCY